METLEDLERQDTRGVIPTVSIIIPHSPDRDNIYINEIKDWASVKPWVEVLVSSEGTKSTCRNELAKVAKGMYLVFLDDDVQPRYDTIYELLMPFSMYRFKNVGVVGGSNQAFPDAERMEKLAAKILANPLATFRSSSRYTPKGDIRLSDEAEVLSCNMAVLKKAFDESGGFPEDIIPCEENVLVNRIQALGYSVVYNPFAMVYHRQPKLYHDYAHKLFDYGRGRGIMMRKNEGDPVFFPKFTRDTPHLILGYIVHVISYVSGVIWGYIRGK